MADQKKNEPMDEVLDSLLANYSSAEPRPGLETRILTNLNESARKESSGGWWNLKWIWMGAVAAALVIIAAVVINGGRHVAAPTNVVVETHQPVPQPEVRPSLRAAVHEIVKAHRRKASSPPLQQKDAALALNQRPAIFPTPTPLSEQERLMFTYLATTPHEVVVAQIQRNDQKEAEAFWEDREPSSGIRRSTNTR